MTSDDQTEHATTEPADGGVGERAQEAGIVDQQAVVKDQIDEQADEATEDGG